MVHDDGSTVAVHNIGKTNQSIGGSDDSSSILTGNIDPAMKSTFTVEWINALTKRSGNVAFHRPKCRRGNRAGPITRGGIGHFHAYANRGSAAHSRIFQGVKLFNGSGSRVVLLEYRIGLKAVKSGNFTSEGAERFGLQLVFLSDLLQLRIAGFECFLFSPKLVVTLGLQEHAGVGSGHPGDSKHADQRAGNKNV